jgi:hypothetical protein
MILFSLALTMIVSAETQPINTTSPSDFTPLLISANNETPVTPIVVEKTTPKILMPETTNIKNFIGKKFSNNQVIRITLEDYLSIRHISKPSGDSAQSLQALSYLQKQADKSCIFEIYFNKDGTIRTKILGMIWQRDNQTETCFLPGRSRHSSGLGSGSSISIVSPPITPPVTPPSPVCHDETKYSCAKGWTLNGNTCSKDVVKKDHSAFVCPFGSKLNEDNTYCEFKCHHETTPSCTDQNLTFNIIYAHRDGHGVCKGIITKPAISKTNQICVA